MSSRGDRQGDSVPEGFTLSMALMDCLPVAFFGVGAGVLATRFDSALFRVGVVLVVLAGVLKVSWKLVLALARRDVRFLNRQMRYLMPVGFVLAVIALVVDRAKWSPAAVLAHVTAMPSLLFLVAGTCGDVSHGLVCPSLGRPRRKGQLAGAGGQWDIPAVHHACDCALKARWGS
jgi:hypothetical protein